MSDEKSQQERGRAAPSVWTHDQIMEQAALLAGRVVTERRDQEVRWGPQNVRSVQKNSTGAHEVGRPYAQFEQIFKYLCDRNRAVGEESMDTIWLEEVFEALAAVVELEAASAMAVDKSEEVRAVYGQLRDHAVEELIQAAAVALKFAGMIQRDETVKG